MFSESQFCYRKSNKSEQSERRRLITNNSFKTTIAIVKRLWHRSNSALWASKYFSTVNSSWSNWLVCFWHSFLFWGICLCIYVLFFTIQVYAIFLCSAFSKWMRFNKCAFGFCLYINRFVWIAFTNSCNSVKCDWHHSWIQNVKWFITIENISILLFCCQMTENKRHKKWRKIKENNTLFFWQKNLVVHFTCDYLIQLWTNNLLLKSDTFSVPIYINGIDLLE